MHLSIQAFMRLVSVKTRLQRAMHELVADWHALSLAALILACDATGNVSINASAAGAMVEMMMALRMCNLLLKISGDESFYSFQNMTLTF